MLTPVELPGLKDPSDAICPAEGGPGIEEPKPPPPKPQLKVKHNPRLPNPRPPNRLPPPKGPPRTGMLLTMVPPPFGKGIQMRLMGKGSMPDGSTALNGLFK